jgi:hypothetical protein
MTLDQKGKLPTSRMNQKSTVQMIIINTFSYAKDDYGVSQQMAGCEAQT